MTTNSHNKPSAFFLALLIFLTASSCDTTTTDTSSAETINQPTAQDEITSTEKTEITFTEMVVVNNDQCSIKITGIDPDDMWGYAINISLENKSPDTNYSFAVKEAAVNGVEVTTLFAKEVAAAKKANGSVDISSSSLEKNGIVDYTDIELTFRVSDADDWMADDIVLETVNIYPLGEDNIVKFNRPAQANDTIIADNEHISAIVTSYENDPIWGYTANLFLVNKTDVDIMFSLDNASVNGYMVDPFFAASVAPNKSAFKSISWSNSALEKNNITDIEEIEFLFKARDTEFMSSAEFFNNIITLTP